MGGVYWFSFPLLTNHSTHEIRIKSYGMKAVGSDIHVVGGYVYSLKRAGAYLLTYANEPHGPEPRIGEPKYAITGPIEIAPGQRSDGVLAIKLTLNRRRGPSVEAKGCVVMYVLQGRTYRDVFRCDFVLGRL